VNVTKLVLAEAGNLATATMDTIKDVGVAAAPKEDLLSYLELLSFST